MFLSVCPCVSALTAEPIDVRSQNLVQGLTLMTSRTSLNVKVKGEGHPVDECNFGVLTRFSVLSLTSVQTKLPCVFTRRILRMRRQMCEIMKFACEHK